MGLRPDEEIPPDISGAGFGLGHRLLGTAEHEVIQFFFHFYGFKTYNVLVTPNNPLVRVVLTMMVESGDYFFFGRQLGRGPHRIPVGIGGSDPGGLTTNLPHPTLGDQRCSVPARLHRPGSRRSSRCAARLGLP